MPCGPLGYLAQEAGHKRIPQFDGVHRRLCPINGRLGELDFSHDDF